MTELKPCPFCYGEPCMQEHKFYRLASTWGVVCLDCCAETRQFFPTEKEAAEAWNRRSPRASWIGEADGYADGEFVYDMWYCSNCDYLIEDDEKPTWRYCPGCGAIMEDNNE